MNKLITVILITPIIGSIICIIVPNNWVKPYSLIITVIVFGISIVLYCIHDISIVGISINDNTIIDLSIDGLNLWFIILTTYLTPIVLLASYNNIQHHIKGYIIAHIIIESILLSVFMVTDLISFYVSFEIVLIPLFITVGVYGTSDTRIRSAYLLFIFTLIGSLIILISLVLIYINIGISSFTVISTLDIDTQSIVFIGLFIAFAFFF